MNYDSRRLALALGLILGSSPLAVLISVSIIALGRRWTPGLGGEASAVVFFADGALAAMCSAAGALLLPAVPAPVRVVLASALVPIRFFAHWFLGAIVLVVIYGF